MGESASGSIGDGQVREPVIGAYIRQNVLGLIAIYLALGGAAIAAIPDDNSVRSRHLVNGGVRTVDLATAAVSGSKLGLNAISANGFAVGDGSLAVATGAINTNEVRDNSLTSADISANAIEASELNVNAIPADGALVSDGSSKIAGNAIASDEIKTSSVGSSEIATNGVGRSEIANDAVARAEVVETDLVFPAVRATSNATHTITPVGGGVIADFPGEDFDIGAMHSTASGGRELVAPEAGIYQVAAQVSFRSDEAQGVHSVCIRRVGGAQVVCESDEPYANFASVSPPAIDGFAVLDVATLVKLAAGESIDVRASTGLGSDDVVTVSPRHFEMHLVSNEP